MKLIEQYFDNIYLLNLEKDKERLERMIQVFNTLEISKFERWNAYTPETSMDMKEEHNLLPSYLACLKSHLTIIQDAYSKGYEKILILEDDIVPINNFHDRIFNFLGEVPNDWDLLYFSYIRLNDDRTLWSYDKYELDLINETTIKAREFWSLMSYAVTRRMMKVILNFYGDNTLIEMDRYFVDYIQKDERFKVYGSIPQLFAGIDNYSNNTEKNEEIFTRSTFPQYRNDYMNI